VVSEEGKQKVILRVNPLYKFSGKRSKLIEFLLKIDIYIALNIKAFESKASKVLYIVSYLEGDIYQWFAPYVKEWLDTRDTN
jgi:hypothetical protein